MLKFSSVSEMKAVITGCLILVVGIFSGYTGAKEVTLTVLTHGDASYLESTKAFFAEFEKQNPDIKVKVDIDPTFGQKFLVTVAGGNPPDLVRLGGQQIPENAAAGLLQDITERVRKSKEISANDFMPIILDRSLSWNGRIYAIPFGISVTSFFYNKTSFDEVGVPYPNQEWRWEIEGISNGKKFVKDTNGDGVPDSFFIHSVAGYEFYPFIYSAGGGPLFSDDGKKFLGNSEATRKALRFVHDLMHVHSVMAPLGSSSYLDFAQGKKVSAILLGSFYTTILKQSGTSFDWDVALIPTFTGERGTNIWPETPWAIPAGARHPELSWRLLEFIGSSKGQALATQLGLAMPPVRLSVAKSVFVSMYRRINAASFVQMAILPRTHVLPTAPSDAKAIFDTMIVDVLDKRKAVEQGLQEATPRIQAVLDKIWKK